MPGKREDEEDYSQDDWLYQITTTLMLLGFDESELAIVYYDIQKPALNGQLETFWIAELVAHVESEGLDTRPLRACLRPGSEFFVPRLVLLGVARTPEDSLKRLWLGINAVEMARAASFQRDSIAEMLS